MRVTEAGLVSTYLNGIRSQREDLGRALRALSDGKRVRVSSDDPAAARAALAVRARLSRMEGATRAAREARFDLATAESVVGQSYDLLVQARTSALAGAASTSNGTPNSILATEVDRLREHLLHLANTQQNGRHLFGGTETLAPPFAADGTYSGNDAEGQVAIDEAETVGSTLSGRRVFQDGVSLFSTLSDLSMALRNDDSAALASLVPTLTAQLDHLSEVRADLGDRLRRIDGTLDRLSDEALRLTSRLAELEDVDLERAVLALSAASTAGDALSAGAAKVLNQSLFDFLV